MQRKFCSFSPPGLRESTKHVSHHWWNEGCDALDGRALATQDKVQLCRPIVARSDVVPSQMCIGSIHAGHVEASDVERCDEDDREDSLICDLLFRGATKRNFILILIGTIEAVSNVVVKSTSVP